GRNLDVVTQAQTKGAYGHGIAADYGRYTAATAIAETAERLTDIGGEGSGAHYALVAGAFSALSRGLHPAELILDSYLLRALSIAGWAPSFTDCARCGAPGPHSAFSAASARASSRSWPWTFSSRQGATSTSSPRHRPRVPTGTV
uniref:DNA repair protein RecO n=1 Tax=Arthrobacter sp. H41 TaxID=1312978 RepID=UPI0020A64EEC